MGAQETLGKVLYAGTLTACLLTSGCGKDDGVSTRIPIPQAAEIEAKGLELPDTPEEHIYLPNLNGKRVEVLRNVKDRSGKNLGHMLLIQEGNLRKTTSCFWDKDHDGSYDDFIREGARGDAHLRGGHRELQEAYQNTVNAAYRQLRRQVRAR